VPRGRIDLRHHVESLSILAPDGTVDETLDPHLDPQDLRRLFRTMLLARRIDERGLLLQRQGRIGTFGPTIGQEAASIGPAFVLRKDDWLIPCFREVPAMLWRGWPIEKPILFWAGHEAGCQVPEGVNDLPTCVPVASQCLHAAGIAWGLKLDGQQAVAIGFVGDGGTSEGDFHEAMNIAGVFNLPLVMVVQNNQWAISLPRAKQTASPTIAQKALAYGFNGLQADGNDILAMIVATREAVQQAREGGGPTLIEAMTYRLAAHTTADDPKRYRVEQEVEEWKPRDPLIRLEKFLRSHGLMNDDQHAALEKEIEQEISAAVERAESYQPDVFEPFRHCFATMPPELQAQMHEFEEYLKD
jgi:pyruvate dehydrogenase E1 component alpha subunit